MADVTTRTFDDGEAVFRQGDLSGTVYLVQAGAVHITKTMPTGEVIDLGTVGPRGLFGEMALIDSTLRMATATAVGSTRCLVLEAAQVTRQLELLSARTLRVYHDMLSYIRGNLPFDARTAQQQARGETGKDREARALLAELPGVIAAEPELTQTVRAVLTKLGQYVERRLPPAR